MSELNPTKEHLEDPYVLQLIEALSSQQDEIERLHDLHLDRTKLTDKALKEVGALQGIEVIHVAEIKRLEKSAKKVVRAYESTKEDLSVARQSLYQAVEQRNESLSDIKSLRNIIAGNEIEVGKLRIRHHRMVAHDKELTAKLEDEINRRAEQVSETNKAKLQLKKSSEIYFEGAKKFTAALKAVKGFCKYCGATYPHREGEGRCDHCQAVEDFNSAPKIITTTMGPFGEYED